MGRPKKIKEPEKRIKVCVEAVYQDGKKVEEECIYRYLTVEEFANGIGVVMHAVS